MFQPIVFLYFVNGNYWCTVISMQYKNYWFHILDLFSLFIYNMFSFMGGALCELRYWISIVFLKNGSNSK